MALRVGHITRLRSSSGLSPAEEATDTVALIRKLFWQNGTSDNDEYQRLSETADKLRLDLGSNTSSKDTFRHGGGFQKILHLLSNVTIPHDTPQDLPGSWLGFVRCLQGLLRLLAQALLDHGGNERYFRSRLDGWTSIQQSCQNLQTFVLDHSATVAQDLAALYDCVLAFAYGSDDFGVLSNTFKQSNSEESQTQDLSPPRKIGLPFPEACATVVRLALQLVDANNSGGDDQALVSLSENCFRNAADVAELNLRNTLALWNTNVLSSLLSAVLDFRTPESWKKELERLLLSVGSFGMRDLNDVALLFRNASGSDAARSYLQTLVQTSKEPSFIQFDLATHGYFSIEVSRLPGPFPPSVGYTLTAWIRIDEYDPQSHTTLFGAYDANHTCFMLMYLEKDSHLLILQTSVRARNPSIRFKSTRFESSRWYHIALVQRKNLSDPSQSVAMLFVDGIFSEQRKCNYPDTPEEIADKHVSSSGQRRFLPVQAFFGTPRNVAMKPVPNAVTSKWSLGNAHLYQVPLSDEFVAVHHRLSPRYSGNFQDCLGALLTYRGSAELNRYNEGLHPDKADRSDISTATNDRGSEVVSESRMLLGISANAVIVFDTPNDRTQPTIYELDRRAMPKYQQLSHKARAIAINTAIAPLNDAISRSFGVGVFTGDPMAVVPRSLDDASWCLTGSLPVLLRLVEGANTKKAFIDSMRILLECVKDNWRVSEAMEKEHGYGLLAVIIREKLGFETGSSYTSARRPASALNAEDSQALPLELLPLLLDFLGYDKERPEDSLLINPMGYRVMLLDFDTWRRCGSETQSLYYKQFVHFASGNKNSAFNQKRLSKMRVVKKLIEALKFEDISVDAAALMMEVLRSLLDANASHTLFRDLTMFVIFGLHDSRTPSAGPSRHHMATTVGVRQKIGAWAKGARNSRPSTPIGAQSPQPATGVPRFELAVLVLKMLVDIVSDDGSPLSVKRFSRAVPSRWLLHLLAETDTRVLELTLSIISRSMTVLGAEFKSSLTDKNAAFITLRMRLKHYWRSKAVWILAFAILFGRDVPRAWLGEGFSALHLIEILAINDLSQIAHADMLPCIFGMLEAGLRKLARDDEQDGEESKIIRTVIQFLSELVERSSAFREFAIGSRYVQELLFVLFPLLTGTDRLSAETELQSEALSFKGEEVKMRPHSNSVGERPPSVRSLTMENGKRTPSPMAPNRVQAPRRISSFILVNEGGDKLSVPPTQFHAPMAPKATEPVKINVTNSLVESLLELAITLFIDQVCYREKYSGIGLFLKVPPSFQEYQAYFESYVLVNSLSQLGSHLRLHQNLLVETKVLTNLARYTQHMAEAVMEGWFIDGAQPLLDFTGEILEHLQNPEIASVKSVRLCSQSTNAIRIVFLKATLWRLSELDEDKNEEIVGSFLRRMTYWQTILFSAENQETLFTKLICFLLYHKLVSGVKSVRLAAANLWRMVLVQKPTETATMLTNTMGPEQRHLSTGFMKLVSMDDDDFLAWVDQNRGTLDTVFHNSLSRSWDEFVQNENRTSDETAKNRLNKRREKLRQWQTEETTADDYIYRYETSTNHWRVNLHAQERLKLQRAIQDHHENVNHLYTAFGKLEKRVQQPCGLEPATQPTKWQLDETEAANRMRMRIVPDSGTMKEAFQPKRKASRSVSSGNKLAINTQIPRLIADDMASPLPPPTPGTPLPAITDGTSEYGTEPRARSDSVSNSQLLEGAFEIVDDPREDVDGVIEDKNRKVMTSLQRGDMVQALFNISRIVGLEACEGLLVVGQKCIYMQDNFFQRSDGEILSVSQAPEEERDPYVQLISGKDIRNANTKHSIGDQETRHWTWAEVLSVSRRRFLLRDVSLEIFFTDGRSYLLTCMSSKIRDDLYNAIAHRAPHVHSTSGIASEDAWRLDTLRNPEDVPKNFGTKFGSLFNAGPAQTATKRWQRGEMSNFQYLMLVNTMAGRTFNDLTQYPIFPWVLADYTSEELDLTNPLSFRDLSKPMGCQTPAREADYKDRYKQFAEMGDGSTPSFHYGTHYSSAMIVSSYLIRLQPFVQSYLLLQGGAFDHADRLFDSIEKAWLSASRDTMSDVRELTPEFFYLPEFLTNINKYDFGMKQVTNEVVNNVHLPKWAKGDPHIFIAKHREALESPYVSEHLHDWIDLVFGFKQRGEAAIEATNVFQHLSYAGARDLDKIDDQVERLAAIGIIHSFGQTPHQIFQKPHPDRELDRQAELRLDSLAETLTRLPDTALKTGEKVADFTYSSTRNQLLASGPCKLNVLPDCDRYMQWGFADHSIRFFSKNSKRLLGLYENTHIGPVSVATFVDSKTLVTGGEDCTIGVWNVKAARDSIEIHPKTYLFGHRKPVTILAASRVFSTLLSCSADGQVLIWGLNRQNCIRVLLPPGSPTTQTARISNVSGHILLCQGPNAALYTINGHLLVSQNLCDPAKEEDEILCCSFYEGAGGEYLERELIFTGHARGVAKIWTLATLADGKWELVLVKRMEHGGGRKEGITAILPSAKAVWTGDEEGNVWSWECIVRERGGRR